MKRASIYVGLMSFVQKIESTVCPQAGYKLSQNNNVYYQVLLVFFFLHKVVAAKSFDRFLFCRYLN